MVFQSLQVVRRWWAVAGVSVVGLVPLSVVALPSGLTAADTPGFSTTCTGVTNLGTVIFPTVISGSIPTTIDNGSSFSLADEQWHVTVPAVVTSDINGTFPPSSTVTATVTTTIDATGASPGSQAETISYPAVTVPASGPFSMTGTPLASPSFTATGGSVSITPGPSISAFQIDVDGNPIPAFPCTTPTPSPTIAFAQGSNGPFAYVGGDINSESGTTGSVNEINTATQSTVGGDLTVGRDPDFMAATPNGADVFVSNNGDGTVSEISTGNNHVVRTINLPGARGMAMAPNGSTLYVTGGVEGNELDTVNVSTGAVGGSVTVGGGAAGVALTPDGTRAFVVNQLDGTVSVVNLANLTVAGTINTGLSLPPEVEMAPDGSTAYVDGDGLLQSIDVATLTLGPSVGICLNADRFAISPDGAYAWVACSGQGGLEQIDLATNTQVSNNFLGLSEGDQTGAVSVTPDGSTVYVVDTSEDAVVPFDVASLTAGSPINLDSVPVALTITADQGPTAALTATTVGATTTFDASASVQGTSPIVSYSWNFGDGQTAVTSTPTTTHNYAGNGTFTASVTETDAVGTSTSEVYTGQSASLYGTAAAETSTTVVIAVDDCAFQSSCHVAVAVPATRSAPAETVSVTAPAAGGSSQQLDATAGPGQLACTTGSFTPLSNVTSYDATFTPTGNVKIKDLIAGATSTTGIRVCFEGTTSPPVFLPLCNGSNVPCDTLSVVPAGVKVKVTVAPGDPKLRIDDAQTLVEKPTKVSASASSTGTINIKGTELLGPTGKTRPSVGFTSVNGSIIPAQITSATATKIVVQVPPGAATGPVHVTWPQETVVSDTPVVIT